MGSPIWWIPGRIKTIIMTKKRSNTKQIVRYYLHHTMRYKWRFALVFLNNIQTITAAVLTPLIMGLAVSKIADPSATSLSYGTMLALIIALSVIGIVANRIGMRSLSAMEIRAQRDIYLEISEHLMHESYDFHARSFSGALLNQANRLSQGYVTFTDTLMMDCSRSVIIVVVSSAALAFYDPVFALLVFGLSAFGLTTTVLLARKRYPWRRAAVAAGTKQSAYLADIISNAVTVKSFAAEQHEQHSFDGYLKDTAQKVYVSWQKQITGGNIINVFAAVMNISILAYGIFAIQHGLIPLGVFIAAQLYAVRINGSFWDLTRMVRTLENVFSDAEEMTQILQEQPTVLDAPGAEALQVAASAIHFDHATFRYPDAGKDEVVLSDFNLQIAPGEHIGLVGHSGGGKTTITKLLLRFMDIQEGVIAIDGQNISDVTQVSLRQAIAYVPQEPLLFHRSLAENICYGKPNATEAEVRRAAKLAHADSFIATFPKGYETEVGERGVKLSGGQRQRIAIARAMIKDAPILVLDEATSALDSESEKLIQSALWELMKDRTAIVIAHRLSTIQKMDRIIVLDNGKIVEQGTHKELLRHKGVYASLWAHQSGGFIED
jgi:ATP-binding cassette subfamily B protein